MPYIITTSVYPSDKASDVAERWLEALAKYPPDENLATQVVPAAVKATHKGISGMTVFEVKEGKLQEAIQLVVKSMAMFQSIAGFEHSIDIHYTAEEAMEVIGMSMPE